MRIYIFLICIVLLTAVGPGRSALCGMWDGPDVQPHHSPAHAHVPLRTQLYRRLL